VAERVYPPIETLAVKKLTEPWFSQKVNLKFLRQIPEGPYGHDRVAEPIGHSYQNLFHGEYVKIFSVLLEVFTYLLAPFPLFYFYASSKLKGREFEVKGKFNPPDLPSKEKRRLWFHGVSVGEVLSLAPLLKRMAEEDFELLLSTTTSTGYRVAKRKFPSVPVFYFPLDLPHVVEKFLKRIQPDGIVIAETELWPNFIKRACKRDIKLFIVNGRLSLKSLRWYKRIKPLMKNLLGCFHCICVQNEEYRQRFLQIGAPRNKLFVTGNMKADFEIKPEVSLKIKEPYIVAGSTMDREEDAFVLEAFKGFDKRGKLIIAPRHPERAEQTLEAALEAGFLPVRRTAWDGRGDWQVMVLDTMGELAGLYEGALLSIIGGSIKPFGGHNLLEPAYFSSPIAFGPHMENFFDLAEQFLSEGAALLFKNPEELRYIIEKAFGGELEEVGRRARGLLEKLKGAVNDNASFILSAFKSP